MKQNPTVVRLREDPRFSARAVRSARACIAVAGLISSASVLSSVSLLSRAVAEPSTFSRWRIPVQMGVAGLLCSAAFWLISSRSSRLRATLALLCSVAAGVAILAGIVGRSSGAHLASFGTAPSGLLLTLGFVLVAFLAPLLHRSGAVLGSVTDAIVSILALFSLTLSARDLFAFANVLEGAPNTWVPASGVVILCLLGVAAFLLRLRYGIFTILLGSGFGSRLARGLIPFLLVMPWVRESFRARILRFHFLPELSATALMSSIAAGISIALLLAICIRIRSMEEQIRDLSVRDELTGLYNLRGFRTMAEHAFAVARRSGQAFSVLFVDLDDLKQINDRLGHATGSAFLVETAARLRSNFRESDVLGRIGGDEFAMAGQFNQAEIVLAAQRLEQAGAASHGNVSMPLSLSFGHVTAEPGSTQTLEDLLHEADAAMYRHKSSRRSDRFGSPVQ